MALESPTSRLLSLLSRRLRVPLTSSLLLLPVLPAGQANLIFELLPLFRSFKALLNSSSVRYSTNAAALQQWLAYWLLYTVVRLLEATRVELDGASSIGMTELQGIMRILPRFIYNLVKVRSTSRSLPNLPPRPTPIPRKRKRTLATQLAGTPLRWTAVKFVLLFYAMDEELQGARWILEKLVKPVVGFFTGLEDRDNSSNTDARRSIGHKKKDGKSSLHGSVKGEEDIEESLLTPELSLETDSSTGSTGGRSSSDTLHAGGVEGNFPWLDLISARVSAVSHMSDLSKKGLQNNPEDKRSVAALAGLLVVEEGNQWEQ